MSRSALFGLAASALLLATFSCKKDSQSQSPAVPTDVFPNAKAATPQWAHAGDTLQITGTGLGTDTSKIKVMYNDSIQLRVYQAKDTVFSLILPAAARLGYVGNRTAALHLSIGTYSNYFDVTVWCPEPKGWELLYTGQAVNTFSNPQNAAHLAFPSDSIGYMEASSYFMKTRDGGVSWQYISTVDRYTNMSIAAPDTSNVWLGNWGPLSTSTDGGNSWQFNTLPAMITDVSAGVYLSGPKTGVVAGGHGEIYAINGSYDTSTMTLDYQSQYYNGSSSLYSDFWAVDKDNLMAGGQWLDGSTTPASHVPLVAIKTNGVYSEYLLPSAVTTNPILRLQLVASSLGYALTTGGELLKFTGGHQWARLTLPTAAIGGFWFSDANNGWIVSGTAIYNTSDGGQTWNSISYTLASGFVVFDIKGHNDKLWIFGGNYSTKQSFLYKYNP